MNFLTKLIGNGYSWLVQDVWYNRLSNNPKPYSVKKYLQDNLDDAWLDDQISNQLPTFKGDRDTVAGKSFLWVTRKWYWKSDKDNYNLVEYWEDLGTALRQKGIDCETMSLVLYVIIRKHKVPPTHVKYCWGDYVTETGKKIGHAWLEVYSEKYDLWSIYDCAGKRIVEIPDKKYIKKNEVSDYVL
jgi:hypothetical protein